ncbi:hypothetical protein [Clavibacter sp.]|uniref:hypothetical protein n=1 Tax=Clavibacter sp. TaxID=1871044 RepID=UPI0019A2AF2D|nr:hypothetical protein [Clavibacter sp.]MBD5381944.1 hypothetical protein [Clavibacter sp.]
MSKLQDLYINRTREYLKKEAMRMIQYAQTHKDTEDRTGAQHDSYGALIFYNGGIVYSLIADPTKSKERQSIYIETLDSAERQGRHKGWGDIPDGTGTDWAKLLRNEIKSGAWGEIPQKGFCLIVFNAAFYTSSLEKGEGYTKPYKILSLIAQDMEDLQSKYKKQGATLRWHGLNIPDRT